MSGPAQGATPGGSIAGAGSLLLEQRGSVLILTINRPERRNALDVATLQAMAELFEALPDRRDVRVLVITGAG